MHTITVAATETIADADMCSRGGPQPSLRTQLQRTGRFLDRSGGGLPPSRRTQMQHARRFPFNQNDAQRNLIGADQAKQNLRENLREILQHLEWASITAARDQEERSFRDFVNYLVEEDAEVETDPTGETGAVIEAGSGVADAIDVKEVPGEESSGGAALDLRALLLKQAGFRGLVQKEHRELSSSPPSDRNAKAIRSKISDLEAEIFDLEAVLRTSTGGEGATDPSGDPGPSRHSVPSADRGGYPDPHPPLVSSLEEVRFERTKSDAVRLQRASCGMRPPSCQDPSRDGVARGELRAPALGDQLRPGAVGTGHAGVAAAPSLPGPGLLNKYIYF